MVNELIRESFDFNEEVLWPNIERGLNDQGLAELGTPSESEVSAFVRRKIEDLDQYKLGLEALSEEENNGKDEVERVSMAPLERTALG